MNYSGKILDGNFLEPYSKEELQEKLKELLAGSLEARDEIITHNVRLVMSIAKKYHQNNDLSELFQVGIIGLIKSVDTFNYEKNPNFITYAYSCITNEILMLLRKNKSRPQNISIEDVVYCDLNGYYVKKESLLNDYSVDIINNYEEKELYNIIQKIITNLPPKKQNIIVKYFGFFDNEPTSQVELAHELGCSQSYVSRIIKTILEEIKLELLNQQVIEVNNSNNRKLIKKK